MHLNNEKGEMARSAAEPEGRGLQSINEEKNQYIALDTEWGS